MKTGRGVLELFRELQRQANAKRDFLAPAHQIRLHTNGLSRVEMEGVGDSFHLNEVAHGQLAEYAGVPKPFYDRLRTATSELRIPLRTDGNEEIENPDLADTPLFDAVVNRLLESKGSDKRLVRTLDGNARAFLSDCYNPDLDNFDVFKTAIQVLEQHGLEIDNVISAEVTERRLYIKVISPRMQGIVQPNNIRDGHGYLKESQLVQAGFIVTNSETGLGSLQVQQIAYKLACTNLWVIECVYRQRHLGKILESDEDGSVYRSDTRIADATARLLKVRDHVAEALNEHKFMTLVARMQETTEVQLGPVDKVVEVAAKKFALTTDEKDTVFQRLIEGADTSIWGLSNAITAASQSAQSYDRATELETLGGRLFSLPREELRSLANAT